MPRCAMTIDSVTPCRSTRRRVLPVDGGGDEACSTWRPAHRCVGRMSAFEAASRFVSLWAVRLVLRFVSLRAVRLVSIRLAAGRPARSRFVSQRGAARCDSSRCGPCSGATIRDGAVGRGARRIETVRRGRCETNRDGAAGAVRDESRRCGGGGARRIETAPMTFAPRRIGRRCRAVRELCGGRRTATSSTGEPAATPTDCHTARSHWDHASHLVLQVVAQRPRSSALRHLGVPHVLGRHLSSASPGSTSGVLHQRVPAARLPAPPSRADHHDPHQRPPGRARHGQEWCPARAAVRPRPRLPPELRPAASRSSPSAGSSPGRPARTGE